MYEIITILTGYGYVKDGKYVAKGTVTLVKGPKNILVDTGSPCPEDKNKILKGLSTHNLLPEDIEYVIGTHGHVDHVGNLNLFPDATIFVGFDIYQKDCYLDNNLSKGESYPLSEDIEVIPTPGHTCHDITLLVKNTAQGVVAVAGDLFECEDDILDENLWRDNSNDPQAQHKNRIRILALANFIVPGHGCGFTVKPEYKQISPGR